MNLASSCHWPVSRVIADADNPAPEPRNCSSAGPKSPLDSPCRYSSGNTSAICGDLRAHAGRMAEENRCRSPVSRSTRPLPPARAKPSPARAAELAATTSSITPCQPDARFGSLHCTSSERHRPATSRPAQDDGQKRATRFCLPTKPVVAPPGGSTRGSLLQTRSSRGEERRPAHRSAFGRTAAPPLQHGLRVLRQYSCP